MAIEYQLTEDEKKNAVDLMVTMVVDEIAKEFAQNPTDVLPKFLCSDTGKLLLNEESKLWWDGPSDIVERYKDEIKSQQGNSRDYDTQRIREIFVVAEDKTKYGKC